MDVLREFWITGEEGTELPEVNVRSRTFALPAIGLSMASHWCTPAVGAAWTDVGELTPNRLRIRNIFELSRTGHDEL
jgi:hypothetical protein